MADRWIGRSLRRPDAHGKLTGELRYASEHTVPEMLVGRVLRSDVARARIRRIDLTHARAIPGVVAAIGPQDLGSPIPRFGALQPDQPVLADGEIRFHGEALAAVAAVDADAAREALDAIVVEYDELPAVASLDDARHVLHEVGVRMGRDAPRRRDRARARVRVPRRPAREHGAARVHRRVGCTRADGLGRLPAPVPSAAHPRAGVRPAAGPHPRARAADGRRLRRQGLPEARADRRGAQPRRGTTRRAARQPARELSPGARSGRARLDPHHRRGRREALLAGHSGGLPGRRLRRHGAARGGEVRVPGVRPVPHARGEDRRPRALEQHDAQHRLPRLRGAPAHVGARIADGRARGPRRTGSARLPAAQPVRAR